MGRPSFSGVDIVQHGPMKTVSLPGSAVVLKGDVVSSSSQARYEIADGFLAFALAVTIIIGTVVIIMCTVWGVVRGGRRKQYKHSPLEEDAFFLKDAVEERRQEERVIPSIEIETHLSEEEDAYQAVGLFWAHWYEETGDPSAQKLLHLLMVRQRSAAFSCLHDMVAHAPIAERHCVLSALSEGKALDSWRAFQKCSTTVVATLRIWARLKANKEAAAQRQKRAEARRRQKEQERAQPPIPSVEPQETWHEILGVPPHASLGDITIAYKCLIKQHHPDRFVHIGGAVYEDAVQVTKRITWAFHHAKQVRQMGDVGLSET